MQHEAEEQAKKSHENEKQLRRTAQAEEMPLAEEGDSSVDDKGAQDEETDNGHCKPGRKNLKIFITKKKGTKNNIIS